MADLGVAGGKGMGLIFRKGKVVASLPEDQLLDGLMKEAEAIVREKAGRGVQALSPRADGPCPASAARPVD